MSIENGLKTPNADVAAMMRATLENPRQRVLLCEHLRLGVTSFSQFGRVDKLTHIITGKELSRAPTQRYGAAGPRVLRV